MNGHRYFPQHPSLSILFLIQISTPSPTNPPKSESISIQEMHFAPHPHSPSVHPLSFILLHFTPWAFHVAQWERQVGMVWFKVWKSGRILADLANRQDMPCFQCLF
eukprot:TRINITY_DN1156_c0_g1_i1.p2 TRINITY_DN1156_c0_g1~~TRINITY_DN1156_c0_g1_i1.p2  ORF type:complete len:106 (+),score=4.03 TRINITY_DN1156_c0_g1_i1:892-1209(+)